MVQRLYSSHAIPLFNHYNILPLNFQYYKSVCTILHDVSNNSLPANISNLFLYPTQVHSYNTRFSATGSFNIKYSKTNQLKHSFSLFLAVLLLLFNYFLFKCPLPTSNSCAIYEQKKLLCNRPFPSSLQSLFQSESKGEFFVMVISSKFNVNKN